jgi:cell division inhibitor SepF
MSALRKAGVWLGLVEDDGDAAYDERELAPTDRHRPRGRTRDERYDDYPDDEELPPAGRERETQRVPRPPERDPDRAGERSRGRDLDLDRNRRATVRSITRDSTVSYLTRDNLALAPEVVPAPAAAAADRRYQITTLHPTTYREARTIGEHFRDGTPVIMNLTEMEEADARRLVDFGAGLAFGLRGTMERVTNRVFLLSPANVHVTAEDKAKIAEGEFFHHR